MADRAIGSGAPDKPGVATASAYACEAMQAELSALRQALGRELCAIPPPVPACDVHFNRLLEDRARVVDELQTLARLRASQPGCEQVLAFCRASRVLDVSAKSRIATLLLDGAACRAQQV
ncbi:MAG: hypothetical protein IT530_12735 [Burkholderiales bacterium]|nr:hypothetical protein [Burkholderiales bacterium]